MNNRRRIYTTIVQLLEKNEYSRVALLNTAQSYLSERDNTTPPDKLRSDISEILNEMQHGGLIKEEHGVFEIVTSRPIILRAEKCEKAILEALKASPKSKAELRSTLEKHFGTDKTASVKDDNTLHTFIGQLLKRLVNLGVIELFESKYRISPEKAGKVDCITDMLALKGDFLQRLHARGGEFFENYFMTLLGKYYSKQGKTVIENHTTGGTSDGGIDGIIKTVDSLGFRETTMVQTKNRIEQTNETTVRGFYGAVCAAHGSRGIFVTSSDFHPSAQNFLDSIDNCVGINDDTLFKMAIECSYGIKKKQGRYVLDSKVI